MPPRSLIATILIGAALLAIIPSCRQEPTVEQQVAQKFLADIAYYAGEHTAQRIANMPFLDTPLKGADLPALATLAGIAKHNERDFVTLLEHNITDESSWRVVPQRDLLLTDSELARDILDSEKWRLLVRQTVMPDGDVATVGILWPVASSSYRPNHEIVAKALHTGWHLNGGLPVPNLDLPVILGIELHESTQARLRGNHIEVSPEYSCNTPTGRWVLAHEVAHLWWHDNPGWIDEGMAELVAALATGAEQPKGARTYCAVPDITTLNSLNPQPVLCDYDLGRRLFQGLHKANLSDFAERTRQLYSRRKDFPLRDDDIRNAFDHDDYWPTLDRYLPPPPLELSWPTAVPPAKPPTE